jgi:outer membrane lipoprotein SlyB
MKTKHIVKVFALLVAGGMAQGDTLTLWNGTRYSGRYLSGTSTGVNFQLDNGTRQRFSVRDIRALEFGSAASSLTPRSDVRYDQYGRPIYNQSITADSRTVPAGTELFVRTNEDIRSDMANEGRPYRAEIERDVVDGAGNLLIPRGSPVDLIVRDLSSGGVVRGPELTLDLQDVTIAGQRYLVDTSDIQRASNSGIGANRRTATMVGGGAALGTLIGAVAGGGRGALIGAIAGAVTGGAAQVLTKGKEVNVPAETVLNFRLDQPLQLVRR